MMFLEETASFVRTYVFITWKKEDRSTYPSRPTDKNTDLVEEKLCQIGPVLPSDARDDCLLRGLSALHHRSHR